jgi:hypothetical protein
MTGRLRRSRTNADNCVSSTLPLRAWAGSVRMLPSRPPWVRTRGITATVTHRLEAGANAAGLQAQDGYNFASMPETRRSRYIPHDVVQSSLWRGLISCIFCAIQATLMRRLRTSIVGRGRPTRHLVEAGKLDGGVQAARLCMGISLLFDDGGRHDGDAEAVSAICTTASNEALARTVARSPSRAKSS